MFQPFRSLVYLQISPDSVLMRHIQKDLTLHEPAEILLSSKQKLLAFGQEARMQALSRPDATLVKPFVHPRLLIPEFEPAEMLLRACKERLLGKFFSLAQCVVHPLGDPEGGYTELEKRMCRELAARIGFRQASVWCGPALSDQQLLSAKPRPNGEILLGAG
jgi:rod shape-determining protein MreB